ncbi:hypothetical protein F5X68DRAFT_222838 [Plectosphaerella plurivora]|uniref:Uncharacterized protein n=1 Tax=Plectosphaerella plurivora TaxID=936078 RepID=A0A9P9AB64_9PEZI|nr:hypothetical protein F5X68DRAFT_222838 [Plectosphaerella plurivora]
MPRFSVGFGRRKSTAAAEELQNAQLATAASAGPSFRVLERTEVTPGKSFDGGARLSKATTTAIYPRNDMSQLSVEDNMFADIKTNRGSGSSNTTKTASTDASSRHSNVSTAPSSADLQQHGAQEEWKSSAKYPHGDMAGPNAPKPSSRGFFDRAGRTFSFGGQKKPPAMGPSPDDHPLPSLPLPTPPTAHEETFQRPRGMTASTSSTATPPKLDDTQDFNMDMGSDFGKMFDGRFKRNSAMTLKAMSTTQQQQQQDTTPHPGSAPRTLTGNRASQAAPTPIHVDRTSHVEASPYSWSSQHSNDNLLNPRSNNSTPGPVEQAPPPPRHGSSLMPRSNNRHSDIIEDEDSELLKESLAASQMLGGAPASLAGRARRNDDSARWKSNNTNQEYKQGDENMFEGSLAHASRVANRYVSRDPSPPRNKVMTPAQFERYRMDKERQGTLTESGRAREEPDDDEEDNYEDDEDDIERQRQAAKQRKKQEAHMTVYRQQMMKVTGEAAGATAPRPTLPLSASSPNLTNLGGIPPAGKSEGDEDEDEEIPLAILAAHGFPNKNKPPTRLTMMASNPDMRGSVQQQARPGSSMGDQGAPAQQNRGSHLPAFARRLPQDPFLGAGLVNNANRDSMHLGGGAPAQSPGPMPPGGLVGVIAHEERTRAMRRGSPHIENFNMGQGNGTYGAAHPAFDPVQGIPPNMMYNNNMGMPQMPQQSLTVGDQAQLQMNQQMQQFMQMQMQFMQMMAVGGQQGGAMGARPMSYMPPQSVADMSSRQSFVGDTMFAMNSMMDPSPRPGMAPSMRTMSMVQPNSESWIQPGAGGYAPSIHAPQGAGYAPSIAPSERSNVGLPGRYRAVSQVGPPQDFAARRTSTMSGALNLNGWDQPTIKAVKKTPSPPLSKLSSAVVKGDDEDDEKGWEAMKAKREKKRSLWRTKKTVDSDIAALIT